MSVLPARGAARLPVERALPQRVAQHAAATPDAMAIVYGEWRLTYRDLNQAANRLAHHLRSQGVARDVPVAIALDRGPDLLVALLAVLKAGGAYVPVDPHWPRERLVHMLALVHPPVLITRATLRGALPACDASVVDLDRDQPAIAACSPADPDLTLSASQLCYLMFTSGSTGVPKAVRITYGNLEGLFPPLTSALSLGPRDVWTWFHSAAFGFSVWEIWGAFLHGACLVIVPESIRADAAALGELIADENVTVFSQTPSAFRRLLEVEAFHRAIGNSPLRYLALSGEPVRPDDIAGWLERHDRDARPGAPELVSTFAITETAGQLTLRRYAARDAAGDGHPTAARNLGQVLDGREIRVLDAAGLPVAAGAAGELWVGGACVSPGYLGDGPANARAFSELALPGTGVVRGYRTGDRVRMSGDGSLDFLGRTDDQLKFRGHRIEPGDIENSLREHPAIRDTAVAVRTDRRGNARLTAYIVPRTGPERVAPANPAVEFWPSLGDWNLYDGFLYGLMNAGPKRVAAHRAAFARHAAGKVALDIGTGDDALLARLCIEAGARHVYAVELLESAAHRAKQCVRSLGLEDRITVIHGDMASITLPKPVELCTQGIVGNIGSADGIAEIWNVARRFFTADCVPVPARCTTRVAAVELPAAAVNDPRFAPLAADYARRIHEAAGHPFDLRLCVRGLDASALVSTEADFEVLDFAGPLPLRQQGAARLTVTRRGRLDGLLLWTVVDTLADATDATRIDALREQQAWLPVFFPAPVDGIVLEAGETLALEWSASPGSDARQPDYVVRVTSAAGRDFVFSSVHAGKALGTTPLHRRLWSSMQAPDAREALPPVNALRSFLATRLPEHMIPQSFVILAELPLGPGGKLDRDALPMPEAGRPDLEQPFVAPRNAAEAALALLWSDALGLDGPGVEDDFFDLGGDSITAVQLTTAIQRWLDAPLPLAVLFAAPTIGTMASAIAADFGTALEAALRRPAPREQGEL